MAVRAVWDEPKEPVRAAAGVRPEDHVWDLAGCKRDPENPTTYFLWGCKKCGRRVVTETASKDAEHFADQNPPESQHLRRGRVDQDCQQALVDGVHDL